MSSTNDHAKHFSVMISGVIASLTTCFGLLYLAALFLMYRNAQLHPRKLKSQSGKYLQRYSPVFYAFLVFSNLIEIALSTWLLLQHGYNHNAPNSTTEVGLRVVLFSACWTAATAGIYTILFLHHSWYKLAVASVGAQSTWLLFTWIFWVTGASLLNSALPTLVTGGSCVMVAYCGQTQTLFALAVLQILTLTVGMITAIVLAWQSIHPVSHAKAASIFTFSSSKPL